MTATRLPGHHHRDAQQVALSDLRIDRDLMCMVLAMSRAGITSATPEAPIRIQPRLTATTSEGDQDGFEVLDGLYRIGTAFVAGHTHIDALLATWPAPVRDVPDNKPVFFDFATTCPSTGSAPCAVCGTCHYNACARLWGGNPERPDCAHNKHLVLT